MGRRKGSRQGALSVSAISILWIAASSVVFVAAASASRWYVESPRPWTLLAALSLYTVGNLIIIRLMRDFGLGVAISLSTVVQLVLVNVIAVAVFREQVGQLQAAGIALGVLAVGLMLAGTGEPR
mgnify:CR=1 FL=1